MRTLMIAGLVVLLVAAVKRRRGSPAEPPSKVPGSVELDEAATRAKVSAQTGQTTTRAANATPGPTEGMRVGGVTDDADAPNAERCFATMNGRRAGGSLGTVLGN